MSKVVSAPGGLWFPRWYKNLQFEELEDGTKLFPARTFNNKHLPTYNKMGNLPWIATKSAWLGLFPLWVALAAFTVAGTIRPDWALFACLFVGVFLAIRVLWLLWRRRASSLDWPRLIFLVGAVTAEAWLAHNHHRVAFWILPILGACSVYVSWGADVTIFRKTRVSAFHLVIARTRIANVEGDDIKNAPFRWPFPKTIFRLLKVGSVQIFNSEDFDFPVLTISMVGNQPAVVELVDGIQTSTAKSARKAAEQQQIGNTIAAAAAMAGRKLTRDEVAAITRDREEAQRLHSIIFKESGEFDNGTSAPVEDESPPGETPTGQIPSVEDDQPHVFVVDTDGHTTLKEIVEPETKVPTWKMLGHMLGWWHHPVFRMRPQTGEKELYCPQCGTVYPDK